MIIYDTLNEIAELLLKHSIDVREDLLFEELNRATIYSANCWDIINEVRPRNFFCPLLGEANTTPEQLAWSILYERFIDDYGILLEA
jgi:hypothetical protein